MMSDMMNSHIASFLEGIANGGASIGGAECAPMVKCASLTVPPVLYALNLHPKQYQQIHPKNAHEVPVIGKTIEGAPAQGNSVEFTQHIGQADQPAEHVQRMDCGQQIEEGTVWIGGKIQPLGTQLQPSHVLADNKDQTEGSGNIQPAR